MSTSYAGTTFNQTYTAESAERERQQRQALADRIKSWELSHSTIAVKMGILQRGGTEALKKEIIELAREYIQELEALVASAPMVQKAIGR
jgi:hypothetical protein